MNIIVDTDKGQDMAYINLGMRHRRRIVKTKEVFNNGAGKIHLDLDADGNVLGIELNGVTKLNGQ